jgi:hypothetical protein
MSKQNKTIHEEITQPIMDAEQNKHKKNTKHTKHKDQTLGEFFAQVDDYLHDLLVERAPKLPENVKETFVRFMPIINMIIIFTTVYAGIITLYTLSWLQRDPILSSGLVGYGYLGQRNALANGLDITTIGFTLYFLFKAQMGLQSKEKSAWKFLLFAQMVNTAIAILSFSLPFLFGNLITLYFLYQIKSYYKK